MSEMVERAARAMFESDSLRDSGKEQLGKSYRRAACAALLAALDPEDEDMRKEMAQILYCCACNDDGARQAIDMLRKYAAQGESNGNG